MSKIASATGYVPVGETEMRTIKDLNLDPRDIRRRLKVYLIGNKKDAVAHYETYNPKTNDWDPTPVKKVRVTVRVDVEEL